METSVPVPLEPCFPAEVDERRLWIGNLDSRLTEYHLIKMLQKYGRVLKFDYLFHKSGLLKGQPRGYCFITYESREEAEKAMIALNGKLALSKRLVVKWANTEPGENGISSKASMVGTPVVSNAPEEVKTKNVKSQISAIEAKLKAMEQSDLELGLVLSEPSTIKDKPQSINSNKTTTENGSTKARSTPYQRHKQYHRHHISSKR